MRSQRRAQAGFTLIEMMAVVVLTGILATLAVFSVRKYVMSSKTTEAIEMIGSIKAAEEAYKDETFTYLDVSGGLAKANAYPGTPFTPGKQRAQWGGAGPGSTGWAQLGVTAASPVNFAYACTAGANSAPTSPSTDSGAITITNWPTTIATPWYVVKAYSDLSSNGTNYTVFVGTSFTGDIFSANN